MGHEPTFYLMLFVILGESGVGKTALLHKFMTNKFIEEYRATVGADFRVKDIQSKDKSFLLQIWDTAGQERFQSLCYPFYSGAQACVLVYDVTNEQTFHKIDEWKSKFLEHADIESPEKFPFLLLGNKMDLDDQRSVDESTARNYAKDNNLIFYETSAVNGHNIEEAIRQLSEKAVEIQCAWIPDITTLYNDKGDLSDDDKDDEMKMSSNNKKAPSIDGAPAIVETLDDEKEKSNADLIEKLDGSSSVKEDNERLKREIEDCNIVIDLLKEENKRLSEQNAVYQREQKEAQMRIDELENEIQELRLKALDLTKFMEWDWEMVHLWIMGLEDGKFKKYDAVLSKALSEAETEGEDLLEVSPSFIKFWGIKDRKDREGLNGYIKILVKEYGPKSKENEGFNTLLV